MATAWGGPDPVSVLDGSTYDLGVKYTANADITITDLRIFGGDTGNLGGRLAHIFTLAGGTLATLALPNVMTPGWAVYALTAPVQITIGTTFWVAYDTTGSYGFIANGGYPVNSADTLVTAVGAGFNTNVDQVPNQSSNAFYGLDFVYHATGGNQRPVVGITAQFTGTSLQASATLTIDDELPASVSYVIEWGDGQVSIGVGNLGPYTHTYATAGTYAVMVTATDSGGLTDSAAVCVTVYTLAPDGPPFTWKKTSAKTVLDGVLAAVSAALANTTCGVPKRVTYSPGAEQAWDACDCGQLALSVNRRYRSRGFPREATDDLRGSCDDVVITFDCSLSIVRCFPGPDKNGSPPRPSAQAAAFACQEEDAYVVWNTTWCYLTQLRDSTPRLVTDFVLNDQPSLGPSGACGGSQLNFKFGLYVPCGCG